MADWDKAAEQIDRLFEQQREVRAELRRLTERLEAALDEADRAAPDETELGDLRHKMIGTLIVALETKHEVREMRQELYRLDDKIEAMWDRPDPQPIRPDKPDGEHDLPPHYYETVAQQRLSGVEDAVAELRDHEDYLYDQRNELNRRVQRLEETVRKLGGKA
jgi:predicted  nucleic acid-binding Zn-ribbon protein